MPFKQFPHGTFTCTQRLLYDPQPEQSPLLNPWLLPLLRCPPTRPMDATGAMSSTPQTDGHPMGETPWGQPGTSHWVQATHLCPGDAAKPSVQSSPSLWASWQLIFWRMHLKQEGWRRWQDGRAAGCWAVKLKKDMGKSLSFVGTFSDWGALGICPFGSRKEIQMSKGGETNTIL